MRMVLIRIYSWHDSCLVNVNDNKKLNNYHHHGADRADYFHLHFEAD